jgi:tRNA dimethylallyltransferase
MELPSDGAPRRSRSAPDLCLSIPGRHSWAADRGPQSLSAAHGHEAPTPGPRPPGRRCSPGPPGRCEANAGPWWDWLLRCAIQPVSTSSALEGPSHPAATRPLVIALMGPTASGKTALALDLAESLDLAVLSVDSRQLYRGMDIGTAKPTPAQRARVRHELLDLRDPDQPITLQEFSALARDAIAAEHQRRGIALLVGGTGLYLQALLQGLEPPAVPPHPRLRQQFSHLGQPTCHALLRQADPAAASRIAAADAVRTQRALEVLYATGLPLAGQRRRRPPAWRVLELGLDPPDLNDRIQQRTAALYDLGLVEETAALRARYGSDCPLLQTIGYGEACRLLEGELNPAAAQALSERRTRQYAKRQRTWFRRQHQPLWLQTDAGGSGQPALASALQVVKGVLG